ncbi:hypothetical protein DL95DRAFT_389298 [Leptodontidium sp. 2 PMI_412]|nr:hypothetical protein DL95DRAFT_389298 [Leptodontidium sp. 2 PMI_412]
MLKYLFPNKSIPFCPPFLFLGRRRLSSPRRDLHFVHFTSNHRRRASLAHSFHVLHLSQLIALRNHLHAFDSSIFLLHQSAGYNTTQPPFSLHLDLVRMRLRLRGRPSILLRPVQSSPVSQ